MERHGSESYFAVRRPPDSPLSRADVGVVRGSRLNVDGDGLVNIIFTAAIHDLERPLLVHAPGAFEQAKLQVKLRR